MLPDTYRAHWETTRSRSVAAVQLGEPAFRVRRWLAPPELGLAKKFGLDGVIHQINYDVSRGNEIS